jgi:hypothetical protein
MIITLNDVLAGACKFDLRFVPDTTTFEGRQIRDRSSSIPADYEPLTFVAKALQHTEVQLTWDAQDEGRKRALTKKVTADEIKEDDFKARGGAVLCDFSSRVQYYFFSVLEAARD